MQAVLISALTAAVVTLLIEYAAKPHLEARKDRIVEAHRLRREWAACLLLFIQQLPSRPYWNFEVGEILSRAIELVHKLAKVSLHVSHEQSRILYLLATDIHRVSLNLHYVAVHGTQGSAVSLPDQNPEMANYFEKGLERIAKAALGAFLVVSTSRRSPWRYYSRLRYWNRMPLPELPTYDVASENDSSSRRRSSSP